MSKRPSSLGGARAGRGSSRPFLANQSGSTSALRPARKSTWNVLIVYCQVHQGEAHQAMPTSYGDASAAAACRWRSVGPDWADRQLSSGFRHHHLPHGVQAALWNLQTNM